MHLLTEQTVEVNCPITDAFDLISNMERFGEWFPGVISIESLDNTSHETTGKRYLETVLIPFVGEKKITLLVKEYETNKHFVTEGEFPPLMPRMEIYIEQKLRNTVKISWRMYSRNKSLLFKFTGLPIFSRIMRKRAAPAMQQLKRQLELKIY